MHGQQSEEQQRQRHMLPVPGHGTVGDSSSIKFFSKECLITCLCDLNCFKVIQDYCGALEVFRGSTLKRMAVKSASEIVHSFRLVMHRLSLGLFVA